MIHMYRIMLFVYATGLRVYMLEKIIYDTMQGIATKKVRYEADSRQLREWGESGSEAEDLDGIGGKKVTIAIVSS